MALNIRSV